MTTVSPVKSGLEGVHSSQEVVIPGGDGAGGVRHTKGPWWLETPEGAYVEASGKDHGALARVVWHMDDDRLCGHSSPTQQANARLIAAAPDLLEALMLHETYLAVSQDRGGPSGPKGRAHQAWIDAKNAAIAKATEASQ